jgi:hypothetical protein
VSNNQETVKLNRRLFASAVANYAEQHIQTHGASGYAEAVWGAFTKGGLDLGVNHGAMREWLQGTPGWRKRYDDAVQLYEQRKAGLDPNHPELRRLERALASTKREAEKLAAQLGAYDSKQTAFEQLADTLSEVVQPLEVVDPKIDWGTGVKGRHPVDMVAALTDEHADEVIIGPATWGLERHNFDVFCLRLERWARLNVEYATQHLPKHHVERMHIFKLGDSIHGDGHSNKHRNHFGNSMRAAVAIADAEAEAIAWMLGHVPYINIVGVSGNHPRTTVKKDHVDPHDNFDFMVTALIAARLHGYIAEGRLDIHAPKSWSAFVDVRGKVMALNHGDDVIGTWGIPWYGFAKKQGRMQAMVGRKDARIDFFWYGHHHTDVGVTEAGARAVHSGAFTMTDGWTAEKLAAGGEPMQATMIVDDHPGMRSRLADLPIWVRDPKVEDAFWKGKLKPAFGRTNTLTQLAGPDEMALAGDFPLIKARK